MPGFHDRGLGRVGDLPRGATFVCTLEYDADPAPELPVDEDQVIPAGLDDVG
jgi:hypothetical protein